VRALSEASAASLRKEISQKKRAAHAPAPSPSVLGS